MHIDLDVYDPERVAPANSYAPPGGLLPADVQSVVRTIRARLPIVSATLAAYDPSYDRDDRMQQTALELIDTLTHDPRSDR